MNIEQTIKDVSDGLEAGFDKIASAYDIPEQYHSDAKTALRDEFEHLCKEASFGSRFMGGVGSALGGGGSLGNRLAAGLGAGAVLVGGGLAADAIRGLASAAVNKVGSSFGASADRSAYERALAYAMKTSEILQNDPEKAKRMADTIFGFAPTVAADSNVLTNILVNSIHGDSIDLQTVRAVTELEEKLKKMKNMG